MPDVGSWGTYLWHTMEARAIETDREAEKLLVTASTIPL